MKKTLKTVLITLLAFAIFDFLWRTELSSLRANIDTVIHNLTISHIIGFILIGTPVYIGVLLINKPKLFFESLGLKKGFVIGFIFAFICTIPMLIGYSTMNLLNPNLTSDTIFRWVIFSALAEEFFYRGFLFGQVYRNTKIGFIPSIVIGAVLFALAHMYQSNDVLTAIGVFGTTFFGAILFAWVYVEWNFNLWSAIFLHLFMNLYWILFPAVENTTALGSFSSNIFRGLTLILVISLTIYYKRKRGLKMEVNRNTIFLKKWHNTIH